MRLVVGPLPASVYWRRRAVVLGGAALAVTMIVYSCSAYGKSATSQGQPTQGPSPNASAPPGPSKTPVAAPAGINSPNPSPSPVPVDDAQKCTDAELTVTAVAAKTTMARGADLPIRLVIKNTSNRSCSRDIGADQQELYIKVGTQTVYSSDHCDGPTGTDVRTFPPGHERSYDVTWNGKSSSSCSPTSKRTPDGPIPEAGEYQLFGRVGTDRSEPVTLKLT